MDSLTIKLPSSVRARFLAEVPPKDRDSFATCALIEALDRRQLMQETKQRAKPGPKADVEKEGIGVYLPTELLGWLRGQMRNTKDLSNVIADLLQRARAAGWTAFATDDITSK